ncbi:alpha/beta fold hydrolase [Corynebacterium sp. L4756]|uniref:alpha/beta fold hydrolase n=1 Tax=unclassified Corynebacterium TaxID=2624378 RepID=UPI00374DBD0D
MSTNRHSGFDFTAHTINVAWDPFNAPNGETLELFAREIVAPDKHDAPAIVYLQGGPGSPAPRPLAASGVIGEMLKEFRVILLDQRGTGNSHRIDTANPADVERLTLLRQEYIVEDAEALRKHLNLDKWSLFGQSFGGFCITSYLSRYPESVEHAYLTGGLPTLNKTVDDLYRTTYDKLTVRHDRFYREYPWAEERIREICAHLDESDETLPTGERLSSRRFRTIGINLGRGTGFHSLAYLLENPFHTTGGEKRLRTDFLNSIGTQVSFQSNPLYASIHESIYGGVGGQAATNWAAHRMREEIPGFEEAADPRTADKFYLTGEHIFPWQFDEDPALIPDKDAAMAVAAHEWSASPYDAAALADAPTSAAEVYLDDIFVPFEDSLQTADAYGDLRYEVTNLFQHDGIGHDGAGIFQRLRGLIKDH